MKSLAERDVLITGAHPITQGESRSRNPLLCDLSGGALLAVKKCRKRYSIYRYRYSDRTLRFDWKSRFSFVFVLVSVLA